MKDYKEEGQITSIEETKRSPSKKTRIAVLILIIDAVLSLFMGFRAIWNSLGRANFSGLIFMCAFFLAGFAALFISARFILRIKKSYWGLLAVLFFISIISIVLALSIKINIGIREDPMDVILSGAYFFLLFLSFLFILLDKENY